ncbi:MAG: MinD/ParA family protein [Pseudomonadales bacterium]|nr:MinD/ParA family protein [Pseudomonadales bacterium]MCP5357456.1 MinD/ParA family protein [Pseudomonadales bacterium]
MTEAKQNFDRGRVIAVSSGKGGVGKTNVSVNLAIALARKGHRICVFDADTSLANVNILLNLTPEFTLEHVLNGSKRIEDILLQGPGDITIVPAASGIAEFASLSVPQQKLLLQALTTLEQQFDYLIIDTAAGISENVTTFLQSTEHCVLIVTPEPTSLTDAFALMKVMRRRHCESRIHVLTNMVDNYLNSVDIYKRLSGAASRYLNADVDYLGYVPRDESLRLSVQKQVPVMIAYPGSQASYRFQALADSLENIYRAQPTRRSFSLFWRKLLLSGLKKEPGTIRVAAENADTAPTPSTPARGRFPKLAIVKLQQGMVQLVQSRTLSPQSMKSLLGSVLRQIERYYPEIDLLDLRRNAPPPTKPDHADAERSDRRV